ncbi:MAG: hypothetical protein Q9170_001375 [Blastenia crenularia]
MGLENKCLNQGIGQTWNAPATHVSSHGVKGRIVLRLPDAEARDQHRSFYLNGWIDNGSSAQTTSLSPSTKIFQEGMVIIDHSNQTAENISTKALVGDKPRTRGKMQYVSGLGAHGIIVLIGGNEKIITNTSDQSLGDLVRK